MFSCDVVVVGGVVKLRDSRCIFAYSSVFQRQKHANNNKTTPQTTSTKNTPTTKLHWQ